jgi:uncharacterized membrane protein YraQ (UPF0718 family)
MLTDLLLTTLRQLATTFAHNWPFLLTGAVVAAAMKVYVDPDSVARFFRAHGASSVVLATLLAVATPLCSCGTMAVILGMMASSVPWAPIVAFMAASPLTSPEETLVSAGLFGWPFALVLLATSAAIGLGAGAAAHFLEGRGWLANQVRLDPRTTRPASSVPTPREPGLVALRFSAAPPRGAGSATVALPAGAPGPGAAAACCAASPLPAAPSPCCAAAAPGYGAGSLAVSLPVTSWTRSLAAWSRAHRLPRLADELLRSGARLLAMFTGFAFLGYFVNNLVPAAWVALLFGRGNLFGPAFAALVGLPLYLNSDGSLPMVRAFVDHGASAGAALAFIVTGAGTSLGAISGALTIARWRVVGLVIASLVVGAILAGYGFDLVTAALAAR